MPLADPSFHLVLDRLAQPLRLGAGELGFGASGEGDAILSVKDRPTLA